MSESRIIIPVASSINNIQTLAGNSGRGGW